MRRSEHALNEALELMHFGFRAIVRGPDRVLARHHLTRMHHRVLYFIGRSPNLAVGDLLKTLGITKQALHRPLTDLVKKGLVTRVKARSNRRVVQLRLSPKGILFERALSGAQRDHFAKVFSEAGKNAERGWRAVMTILSRDA